MEIERYSSANRQLKIYLTQGSFLFIFFVFAAYKATKDSVITSLIATCFVTSVFVMGFMLCDATLRLWQMLVLLANPQPGEDVITVISYYLYQNTSSAIVIIINMLLFLGLIITVRKCPLCYIWEFGPYTCLWSMVFSFCLLRVVNLAEWETRSMSPLGALKGLDYGTGMAYSYYYGYLRMILPSNGTASKGIVEKIENFEDNHNITFPVHKMFILIPSSGYIPPDLKEASYQWMESANDLEDETRNRAGTMRRRYHNSIYKIYPDGQKSSEPKYVVAEGATPLMTYYEVQKHNHPESAIYRECKGAIIETFYTKLQEILSSEPDMSDLYVLIYYDDFEHGAKVNVAKIILKVISEIENLA